MQRPALRRAGVLPWWQPGFDHQRHASGAGKSSQDQRGAGTSDRSGARARHPAPRSQAGQRPDRRGRSAPDRRLWPGQEDWRGWRHCQRCGARHAMLHGPRAGPRAHPRTWPRCRCVRARGHPLRDADRSAALPRCQSAGDTRTGRDPRTSPADPVAADGPARSRNHLPQVPAQGAGQALRQRR